MSTAATTPNYLAEAIGIADRTLDIPAHENHFRALLEVVSPTDIKHFLKGEMRCRGCQEWLKRDLLTQCDSCPDSYCWECKTDHAEYCK